ncbi:MAG: glutathione peroxidase [Rhodospirillales bacterium]|nr:MAG: glutathione peroxidase [Rhodospirillales bacterium]
MTTAHDFAFSSIDGAPLPLLDYAGRPVLLVNVASACGFTPQYAGLQELHAKMGGPDGVVVLGVPSNDFGAQEPGDEGAIKSFCETSFGVTFPMTAKQKVIGADAHPLYRWIAAELGEGGAPKWNFHKYLIDGAGRLAGAWSSRVAPMSDEIVAAVRAAPRS